MTVPDAVRTRTLTFNTNGGGTIAPVTEPEGTIISLSAYRPNRSGHSFAGWYTEAALTNRVTVITLTGDIALYAKWTANGKPGPGPGPSPSPVEKVELKETEIGSKGGDVEITVSGTGKANAEVLIVDQNGKEIVKGKTDKDGKVTLKLPENITGVNQVYTIKVKPEGSGSYSTVTGAEKKLPFTDMNMVNSWFYKDVLYVWEHGLMMGTSETTFSPGSSMTRGMLVTVLGRAAGVKEEDYKGNSFSDVSADRYYAPYVKWAKENGIIYGVGGNQFAPGSNITREQAALIFSRYTKVMKLTLPQADTLSAFGDIAGLSAESKEAIRELNRAGIINGKSDTVFDPKGTAKRSELAAMIHRFMEKTQP